jgi:hypothetical protein
LPQSNERLVQLLQMYHVYLKMLSLEHLPGLVDRLAGELGFGPLARLYAETTKSYIDHVLAIPREQRSPVKLIAMMSEVMSEANRYVNEPLFRIDYTAEGDEITIHVPEKPRTRLDRLRAAPVLGILAGVYEASGYKVLIVTGSKKHIPPQNNEEKRILITLEDCGDHACITAKRG